MPGGLLKSFEMSLPDLIEIVPLEKPVHAEITVPGSKSITNRALILAALAEGEVTLQGALWSEDTQIMVECLQELGFMVNVAPDPNEFCNRTITVYGKGGVVPPGGTEQQPLELFVGNAGTAARFLSAFVCLGKGVYRLHGVPRMHERPQAALFKALRELGYKVDSANDKLPATIFGGGSASLSPRGTSGERAGEKGLVENAKTSSPQPSPPFLEEREKTGRRSCIVSIEESSQFASALLLCAQTGNWEIKITGENAEESPYVAMTSELIKVFPNRGGIFQIEPDASSGSYFWAATTIESSDKKLKTREDLPSGEIVFTTTMDSALSVSVLHWPSLSGWQIDAKFLEYVPLVMNWGSAVITPEEAAENERALAEMWGPTWRERCDEEVRKNVERFEAMQGPVRVSRKTDLGDSIMTLIALAPLVHYKIIFADLGRLRVQECERIVALRTELTKCGAKVIEEGDTLTVYPSKLRGAEIETYNDHRMAMCFSILGLKVPGIKIKNPSCVKKTFPNFFQKLAAKPPHGLCAKILDGKTGRTLTHEELFAD